MYFSIVRCSLASDVLLWVICADVCLIHWSWRTLWTTQLSHSVMHFLSSCPPPPSDLLYTFFLLKLLCSNRPNHWLLPLLLLSRVSGVRLCATPQTAAHQAPPSLGFSRQEHWSRLPFPSPMHESEKWKWSLSVVSDSYRPHGLQPTRLLRLWDFPGKSTGVGCHCLLQWYGIVQNILLGKTTSKTKT